MNEDQIHYPTLIDQAMRGVVRDVLKRVQVTGLPGNHHFYISYSTTHPGVRMSEQLRAKYPKEITIVIQHQPALPHAHKQYVPELGNSA